MHSGRNALDLPHGPLQLPAFLPDATQGVVHAVDATDALNCRVQAMQMNVFYLMQRPGSSVIKALGGLHSMFRWNRPIITDSGGFQIYSLIRQNPKYGTITDRGMLARPPGFSRKVNLGPEKSIQLQISYGADAVICLDDCTEVDDPLQVQEESVSRTINWARRCKKEFRHLLDQKSVPPNQRPLLFAVVQGGGYRELRKRCAEELLDIGFDGFGFGGWPLDREGNLLTDIIGYTRELIPADFPMHALGVGEPTNIVKCIKLGYPLFDSSMPTKDARHGRLYAFNLEPSLIGSYNDFEDDWYSYVYVKNGNYARDDSPVSEYCDCLCCSKYSLAYLHHLFMIEDGLYWRLATIHNLRFMMQLMDRLAVSIV